MKTLSEWQAHVYAGMDAKGFHAGRSGDGRDDTLVRLCLLTTEVSEAAQVVKRHGLTDPAHKAEFAEELADVAIRLLDLAGCTGVDLEAAVAAKMAKNMARPHLYGTPNGVAK
jgi:NTP pyrophosphatase (non-canonical NTP hydrolase)